MHSIYYRSFLQYHLHRVVRKKRPELCTNAVIVHENAIVHPAETVTNVRQLWGWEVLKRLHYCCDLSPCDCDLILNLKHPLRLKRFAGRVDILTAARRDVAQINRLTL